MTPQVAMGWATKPITASASSCGAWVQQHKVPSGAYKCHSKVAVGQAEYGILLGVQNDSLLIRQGVH